jgi:hypothetical protein
MIIDEHSATGWILLSLSPMSRAKVEHVCHNFQKYRIELDFL